MVMGDDKAEALALKLEREYLDLDSALIRAFIADYDFTKSDQLKALREQLDVLRASAVAEADTAFDPSGTAHQGDVTPPIAARATEGRSDGSDATQSNSNDTDGTTLSSGLSTLELSSVASENSEAFIEYEVLSPAEKEKCLHAMFPSQDVKAVEYVLKKCGGDFGQATDILLNHVYFDDTASTDKHDKITHKGIDGFDQAVSPQTKKKKKYKKRAGVSIDENFSHSQTSASSPTMASSSNAWNTALDNVDSIVRRTKIPESTVRFAYNQNGGNIKATIRTLIQQDVERNKKLDKVNMEDDVGAAILMSDFPSLSTEDARALHRMTAPSSACAHELGKLFLQRDAAPDSDPIVPQYKQFKPDGEDRTKKPSSATSSTSLPLSSAKLAELRSNAFESASTYHRKAGSNRLFGGAAAYYGQVGRDMNSQMHKAKAAEADAVAAGQSSADSLDLHGLAVKDAMRITTEKVEQWWKATRVKEARSMTERVGDGFTIVTGRGTHSKDGKARLGPAVVRMLASNGWKFHVATGCVVVTGKQR